ncbi:coenzyme Q-binding protein COQ10 homolog, mitochondrial isoform X2 [Quercus lobata]|uniref:coenzyme Q-binding protein COQ10 homolog, mitochondrial isoform X2 n=1 Tax=Quercus lobata TaxID=97700 RepID=UPI0012466842|nr:coenzyme Q-binding protein COQ10 homolog, mitochondrial isoform X2 [Quercus lobata]
MWRSKSKAVLILGQKGLSGSTRVLQHNKPYARIIHTSSLPNSNDFLTRWRWQQQQQQQQLRLFNESSTQRRRFLGCGDGEEGGVLSKVYEEKLVLGYSPEQLFDVVAAVDLYHGFVPWCQRSEVIKHNPDGSFDAELEIGFKFLVESYISHVELNKPKYIKVASVFFKEVVSRLVGSFNERCRLIYGPGVRVHENSYGQRV